MSGSYLDPLKLKSRSSSLSPEACFAAKYAGSVSRSIDAGLSGKARSGAPYHWNSPAGAMNISVMSAVPALYALRKVVITRRVLSAESVAHASALGTAEERATSEVSLVLMTDHPFPGPSQTANGTATISAAKIRRIRRL